MSEVRKDIFTGAQVIVAEQRGNRPINTMRSSGGNSAPSDCPFCPGNEHVTPGGLADGASGWRMRYFANKYPVLTLEGGDGTGEGMHEIFVDTNNHYEELKDFSAEYLTEVLKSIKERYIYCRDLFGSKHTQIFKNKGALAGATQKHSHWQIVAGGFIPSAQQIISANLLDYKESSGGCLYCDMLKNELADGSRIIFENEHFAVIAPYSSRFTYETWLMPKRHFPALSGLCDNEIPYLSQALLYALNGLDDIKEGMDYNILFMDAPVISSHSLFHWHIQILPRLGNLAGYEFSTGSFINHVTPEKAAELIKRRKNEQRKTI